MAVKVSLDGMVMILTCSEYPYETAFTTPGALPPRQGLRKVD